MSKGGDLSIPPQAFGRKVRYRGMVIKRGAEKQCLCGRSEFACSVYLTGVRWDRITWAKTQHSWTDAHVELVGELGPDGVVVTEPPKKGVIEPLPKMPFPCAGDTRSYPVRDKTRLGESDNDRAHEYAEAQRDYTISWIHWHDSVDLTKSQDLKKSSDSVLVALFTDRVDHHRERLGRLWGGPLCVAQGKLTNEERIGIHHRASNLLGHAGRENGLLCGNLSVGVDVTGTRIELNAPTWDKVRLAAWLGNELKMPVDVTGWLEPL